jgi:hypothetical protein
MKLGRLGSLRRPTSQFCTKAKLCSGPDFNQTKDNALAGLAPDRRAMRTIFVDPASAGWLVTIGSAAEALSFLHLPDAERGACRLARALAAREGLVQVLVRNSTGLTIASAVVGPQQVSSRGPAANARPMK